MRRKILVTFTITLLVSVGGLFVTSCALTRNEDGSTSIRLTPKTHKTIGDIGKGGVDLLSILSLFIPALAPITAAAGASVVTWNRMGKKVTKYRTPLEHTVAVLEMLKKDETLWAKVKPYLKGDTVTIPTKTGETIITLRKPSAKTEATIREAIDKKMGAA